MINEFNLLWIDFVCFLDGGWIRLECEVMGRI